jgi:uncharacterized protein (DUF4415 family)
MVLILSAVKQFLRQKNMKSGDSSKTFPTNAQQWESVLAQAPGTDRPLTAEETAQREGSVLVNGGGYQAARAALAAKRKVGQRGLQRAPVKQLVSVRYSPQVIAYFKSEGAGWQTRMDDALKQWISARTAENR